LGVAGPHSGAGPPILGPRVVGLGVVPTRAGEVRPFPRPPAFVVLELLVGEGDHERRGDHPDAGGGIAAAGGGEGVAGAVGGVAVGGAAVGGGVAYLAGDPQLEPPGLGARTQSVELAVEPLGLAAEDPGDLPLAGFGQMGAGLVDLLGSVEQGAVVDPDGVGV